MRHKEKRNWLDPLTLAAGIPDAEECWAFFYSGMQLGFSGKYSILAIGRDKHVKSNNFGVLERQLTDNKPPFENAWFGYLGYGLKNRLEKLPEDSAGFITMPDLWFVRFRLIAVFDHEKKTLTLHAKEKKDIAAFDALKPKAPKSTTATISTLSSNMTRERYLQKVTAIRQAILRGDLYQANLTRKFYGTFKTAPNAFALFRRLCKISPAPYSAFLKLGDNYILSSSPERFLSINAKGAVESRPIKGSIGRNKIAKKDAALLKQLKTSEKDKAENLMIVDLMRNDLARSCTPGSVKVKSLFDITSYATVHHMSSTIMGQKKPSESALDVVQSCFPPGSMTGAPKIQAMKYCSQLEKKQRGIYSGAIGWFGGDGSADLSVVIRTLIIQGKKFEFQVGGGIIADSHPQSEWKETLLKAKAIAKTLGIPPVSLRKL